MSLEPRQTDVKMFGKGDLPQSPALVLLSSSAETVQSGAIVDTRGGRSTWTGIPMPLARELFTTFCAVSLISAQNTPKKQLTARELFYAVAQMPAHKPDPAKAPPKAAPIRSPST